MNKTLILAVLTLTLLMPAIPMKNDLIIAGEASEDKYVRAVGDQFMFRGEVWKVKGFNYYPRDHPWRRMWTEWDPYAIDQELGLAESLNVNVVRTFIHWDTFGEERINPILVNRMGQFLELADNHGMKVIYTLFDFIDWEVIDETNNWKAITHLQGIIPYYKDDPRILAWDIQNEPDISWMICEEQGYEWCNEKAWLEFLENTANAIRSIDGKHLVTIGLFSPDHISKVEPFVDFISFHHYEDPQQLERTISDIQELTGKPIVLEEIGLHTWINRPGDPHNEYDQRRYLEESLKIIKRRDIAGLLFWTLIDYPVGVTFEEVETHNNHMGVFRTDYTWKPSASIIRTFSFQ